MKTLTAGSWDSDQDLHIFRGEAEFNGGVRRSSIRGEAQLNAGVKRSSMEG